MKKTLVRNALGAWLLGSAAAFAIAAVSMPAVAADSKSSASTPKAQKEVGVALQAAITAASAKDFATAQTHIATARAVPNLSEFDQIEIDIVNAFVALGLNDHATALACYKRIIASPMFTVAEKPEEQTATLKNVMLLQSEAKDFAGAIQTGERLSAAGTMDDKAAATLATAYYFNKDYVKARGLAQKSIDAALAAHTTPDKSAMQIVFNSYADQGDQVNARKSMMMMAAYYPEPETWGKLVDNMIGPGLSDMQILQLYRLRVLSGAPGNDPQDFTIGADVALKSGYPGDARTILQAASAKGVSGISAKLATAQAKAAADEKTLTTNDAQATKSKTGVLDTLVAEQYYGYGRYDEAMAAAKRAISKGGNKDAEEPKMIVGMALTASGKYAEAIPALEQVGGNTKQKDIANLWSTYAKSKMPAAAAPAPSN